MRLIVVIFGFWVLYTLIPETLSSDVPNITAAAGLRGRHCKESGSPCRGWDCCKHHWCVTHKHESYCERIPHCSNNEDEKPSCTTLNLHCNNNAQCCTGLFCGNVGRNQKTCRLRANEETTPTPSTCMTVNKGCFAAPCCSGLNCNDIGEGFKVCRATS